MIRFKARKVSLKNLQKFLSQLANEQTACNKQDVEKSNYDRFSDTFRVGCKAKGGVRWFSIKDNTAVGPDF